MYNPYFFQQSPCLFIIISFLFYLMSTVTKRPSVGRVAFWIIIIGFFIHLAGLLIRWRESYLTGYGYIPLANMYESLVFFSWTIVLVYLIVDIRYHQRTHWHYRLSSGRHRYRRNVFITRGNERYPFSCSCPAKQLAGYPRDYLYPWLCRLCHLLRYKYCLPDPVKKRVCQHVMTRRWLPPARTLDEINYKAITIGFPMLTLGIITGAIWAHYAWGSYWSWDPKETGSLVTWLIYAAFLHARYTHAWQGKKTALLSVVGFCAVIFTYFGVNFFLPGLHSYL